MEKPDHFTNDDGDRPWTVAQASEALLESRGFGRVGKVPWIFDSQPRYHRLGNSFLIDLAVGAWDITRRGKELVPPPTAATLRNYAWALVDYLRYCEKRGKDPLHVRYTVDLLQGYQNEMSIGTWAQGGKPLRPATVNGRIHVVLMFLDWAADKGLRKPLQVPKVGRSIVIANQKSSGILATKVVESRRGKLREPARRLAFPELDMISGWLGRLYAKSFTEGLMAETILETAVRREEVAAWRTDTLPLDPQDWEIVNSQKPIPQQSVIVTIRYGTKGHAEGEDHGDKIGPSGKIHVPMVMALKLHEYRQKTRPAALRQLLKNARNEREAAELRKHAVHLFLNPKTGSRYTGQQVYDSWTSPSVDCPKGWSPHKGRHWWACSQLQHHLKEHKDLIDQLRAGTLVTANVDPARTAVRQEALSFVQLVIQPQLRHRSPDTSEMYLRWVQDDLRVNLNLFEKYNQTLGGEQDLGDADVDPDDLDEDDQGGEL